MSIRLFRTVAAVALFAGVLSVAGAVQAQDAWSKLKVGDWAEYKATPAPGMETHMKWVVKSVSDDKVVYTIETSTIMNGQAMGQPVSTEMTFDKKAAAPAGAPPAAGAAPKESEETVQIDGKDVKCKVVEVEAAGQKAKTWTSDDVPFGIVKVEANGIVSQELVKWGNGA